MQALALPVVSVEVIGGPQFYLHNDDRCQQELHVLASLKDSSLRLAEHHIRKAICLTQLNVCQFTIYLGRDRTPVVSAGLRRAQAQDLRISGASHFSSEFLRGLPAFW